MVFILLCLIAASDFPSPGEGVQVIDRALVRCSLPGEEHTLYIMLYNQGNTGTIEILSGVRLQEGWHWESVCIWQPKDLNGDPVLFDPLSVLSTNLSNSSVIITWIDDLDIVEGSANIHLDYNVQWMGFEEV